MPIHLFGNDEQKARWLPDLASGRRLAAFGLTEAGAGSDAGASRTTARLEGGEWVIDGAKMFITNAGTPISAAGHADRPHRRRRDLEHRGRERHARATRNRRR